MVTLDDLVAYCRIDLPDEDDPARAQIIALVEGLRDAAEDYLTNAGCLEGSSLHDLAVMGLVLHWYDNRNAIAYNRSAIPLGLQTIINQLKMEAMTSGG